MLQRAKSRDFLFAACGREIFSCDLAGRTSRAVFGTSDELNCLCFGALAGDLTLFGGGDGCEVYAWRVSAPQAPAEAAGGLALDLTLVRRLKTGRGIVTAVVMTPPSLPSLPPLLLVGSLDCQLRVWDAQTGAAHAALGRDFSDPPDQDEGGGGVTQLANPSMVHCIAYSPTERLFAVGLGSGQVVIAAHPRGARPARPARGAKADEPPPQQQKEGDSATNAVHGGACVALVWDRSGLITADCFGEIIHHGHPDSATKRLPEAKTWRLQLGPKQTVNAISHLPERGLILVCDGGRTPTPITVPKSTLK